MYVYRFNIRLPKVWNSENHFLNFRRLEASRIRQKGIPQTCLVTRRLDGDAASEWGINKPSLTAKST